MAVTESQRQRLFRKVEEVFGPEEAATFMEVVLPGSWSDVATKRDLDDVRQWAEARFTTLEGRMDLRFQLVEQRLETMVTKEELHRELRSLLLNVVTANAAVAALAIAVAQTL